MKPALLRSLRNRNYRLYFCGLSFSFVGTWMQYMAMNWLVYRLSDSGFVLGMLGFLSLIPAFFLAPVAGVVLDRCNRRNFILGTQVLALLQALALALLVFTGTIRVWHMMLLSTFLGVVMTFDMPARQALVVDMLDARENVPNAIALSSSVVNAARLVGPTLAGFLIRPLGEGACFLINAASYLAMIVVLLLMRLPHRERKIADTGFNRDLVLGVSYVASTPPIRDILMLLCVASMSGMSYAVLLPVFARDILGGGPQVLGMLTTAGGLGALVGTLYLASRRSVLGLARVVAASAALLGMAVAAFSFSGNRVLSFTALALCGFGATTQVAGTNTIVQTVTTEEMRGRTMSFFMLALLGLAPFGELLTGFFSERLGPQITILCDGAATVAAAVIFARRLRRLDALVRPLYEEKGILSARSGASSAAGDIAG